MFTECAVAARPGVVATFAICIATSTRLGAGGFPSIPQCPLAINGTLFLIARLRVSIGTTANSAAISSPNFATKTLPLAAAGRRSITGNEQTTLF